MIEPLQRKQFYTRTEIADYIGCRTDQVTYLARALGINGRCSEAEFIRIVQEWNRRVTAAKQDFMRKLPDNVSAHIVNHTLYEKDGIYCVGSAEELVDKVKEWAQQNPDAFIRNIKIELVTK